MSLISLKLLGGAVLVPAISIGITYPVINSLNPESQVLKLESLSDFKKYCWVSIVGGDKGQYSEHNRKLLVCPTIDNPVQAKFYFYNENASNSKELPREVKRLKVDNNQQDITLTFVNGASPTTEVIGVSNTFWSFLYDKELSNICSIVREAGEEKDRLRCKEHSVDKELSKFDKFSVNSSR